MLPNRLFLCRGADCLELLDLAGIGLPSLDQHYSPLLARRGDAAAAET